MKNKKVRKRMTKERRMHSKYLNNTTKATGSDRNYLYEHYCFVLRHCLRPLVKALILVSIFKLLERDFQSLSPFAEKAK